MSQDLIDRLERLADNAPGSLDSGELWHRGKRRRRVEQTLSGAIAMVLVGVLGVSVWPVLTELRNNDETPAATHQTSKGMRPSITNYDLAAMRLPDSFLSPGRQWVWPTFDGPPGALAAVGVTEDTRPLGDARSRPYGIAMKDGSTKFLDLPGFSSTGQTDSVGALSFDGKLFAYWVGGEPNEEPYLQNPTDQAVVAVAVYNTVTGDLQVHKFDTPHGVMVGGMVWSDHQVLWFRAGDYAQGGSGDQNSASLQTHTWDTLSGKVQRTPSDDVNLSSAVATADGMFAPTENTFEMYAADKSLRSVAARIPGPAGIDFARPDLTRNRIAGLWLPDKSSRDMMPLDIVVGEVTPGAAVSFKPVLTQATRQPLQANEVLGWRDGRRIVVRDYQGQRCTISEVSVDTGTKTPLSSQPSCAQLSFAQGIWGASVVPTEQLLVPSNTSVTMRIAVPSLLLAAGVVWLLRRRRVRA